MMWLCGCFSHKCTLVAMLCHMDIYLASYVGIVVTFMYGLSTSFVSLLFLPHLVPFNTAFLCYNTTTIHEVVQYTAYQSVVGLSMYGCPKNKMAACTMYLSQKTLTSNI